jgi:hypothetical protein
VQSDQKWVLKPMKSFYKGHPISFTDLKFTSWPQLTLKMLLALFGAPCGAVGG